MRCVTHGIYEVIILSRLKYEIPLRVGGLVNKDHSANLENAEMIQLRPYQTRVLEQVNSLLKAKKSILVVMPTGAGKTIVMRSIAETLGRPTLLVAHTRILVEQARAAMGYGMVECKTIQSTRSLIRKASSLAFSVLMIDEAHHSLANTYRALISHLRPEFLIGVTATAYDRELLSLYEDVIEVTPLELLRSGYLCKPVAVAFLDMGSLSGVSTSGGDYTEWALANLCDTPERNAYVASMYAEHGEGRRAIAFACSVAHCYNLASAFNAIGIPASAVVGSMHADDVARIYEEHRSGHIQVLISCIMLTEGYDDPAVSCIILARPTKSPTLFTQMVGRGLRLYPRKEDCLLMDFVYSHHNTLSRPIGCVDIPHIELKEAKAKKEATKRQTVYQRPDGLGDGVMKYSPFLGAEMPILFEHPIHKGVAGFKLFSLREGEKWISRYGVIRKPTVLGDLWRGAVVEARLGKAILHMHEGDTIKKLLKIMIEDEKLPYYARMSEHLSSIPMSEKTANVLAKWKLRMPDGCSELDAIKLLTVTIMHRTRVFDTALSAMRSDITTEKGIEQPEAVVEPKPKEEPSVRFSEIPAYVQQTLPQVFDII